MKVNSLTVTAQDLALIKRKFQMFDTVPEFVNRLEQTMNYQVATTLHYKLESIEFESIEGAR